MRVACLALLVALAFHSQTAWGQSADAPPTAAPPRLEFTRLVAHWAGYATPDYLKFLEEAQPDIAQHGFYGAHFWSLAHTAQFAGYPAHFPVRGLKECGDWFEQRNKDIHQRGAKVVGHFNVKFLVGDPDSPEGPRGFFKFYRELWDEKELGPRPVADPLDLLEKNADGTPITISNYSIGGMKEYWGCLNNPHWRAVLKAWVKRGIERGVDGYIANYFYRHNCLCEHCQQGFKQHLADRYTPAQLQEKYAIANLDQHKFAEIVSWHNPAESTPLRREMLQWSQLSNKRAFDDVFHDYGRKLKPGLISAQWDHLGDFSQISGDERCLLPTSAWGVGEDYLWYSSGGSAHFTDLAEGFLGDLTLQCRYLRGAFDDKPFTMGKYEHTRIRAAISELAANGGAPMGFYTNFSDPEARQMIVQYYQFIKRHDALYRANRPAGEIALLFPRLQVHQGNVVAVENFRKIGRELLSRHVLFDVFPDDTPADKLAGYRQVIAVPTTARGDSPPATEVTANLSRFDAPKTVRISVSRPAMGDELTLHFVNYNRIEPEKKRSAGGGAKDEKPIAVPNMKADVSLPAGYRAESIEILIPESAAATTAAVTSANGRVQFTVPEFLVYAVARVKLVKE